jgi:hypothetical protein
MQYETADQQPFLLATLPPSRWQNRLALGIVAALVVVFGVTAPFINTQLQRVDAFIPTLEGICIVIASRATFAFDPEWTLNLVTHLRRR